jgi:hypothetical protein
MVMMTMMMMMMMMMMLTMVMMMMMMTGRYLCGRSEGSKHGISKPQRHVRPSPRLVTLEQAPGRP